MPSPFLDLWQTRDAERWTRDDAGCATRYDRTSTWRDGASEVIERESTCDEQGNPVDEEERAEAYTAAGDRDLVLTDGSYDLAYEQDQLALRDSTSCVNVPPSSTSECRLWNDTWERDDAGHARVWMYDEAWSIADDTRTEYTWEGALLLSERVSRVIDGEGTLAWTSTTHEYDALGRRGGGSEATSGGAWKGRHGAVRGSGRGS